MFDMSREIDVSVNLYSRKVMIMFKVNYIFFRWFRFMKGKSLFNYDCNYGLNCRFIIKLEELIFI